MVDWTAIPDSSLEPGKPARSIDALALRDNPIAITEGATGAPKVQTAGIADNAITDVKILDGNVTAQKLGVGTPERDWVLARTAAATAGAVGTYALMYLGAGAPTVNAGDTVAGSFLGYTDASNTNGGSGSPAGTWRAMGTATPDDSDADEAEHKTLFLRIS